jgi:1,5-anhydro-D-fructose reductase (1,5-anhydro-D-mannitol-forming)
LERIFFRFAKACTICKSGHREVHAMMKLAVLSFWHVHAKEYADQAEQHPDTEIVAIWDEDPKRGEAEAAKRGARFFANLDDLLAQPDIDGVIVTTPTTDHHDVIVRAARAGKHIFTEKVLAPTLAECNQILAAVAEAGVKLMVSLPRLNAGSTQAIQEILAQGLLGQLTLVRVRLSHNGAIPSDGAASGWLPEHFYNLAQCGGGALIDLGCHPMYLARLFAGLPESVSANYGYVTDRQVEDNAVAILRYRNGAIGVVEAGFVNPHSPFSIEIHGTHGSLFYGTPENKLWVRSSKQGTSDTNWVALEQFPPDKPSAFEQWITHIQRGTTAAENIEMAVDLTRLMEASNRSVMEHKPIYLSDLQNS